MTMREKFEKWAAAAPYGLEDFRIHGNGFGPFYQDVETELAWTFYQAGVAYELAVREREAKRLAKDQP